MPSVYGDAWSLSWMAEIKIITRKCPLQTRLVNCSPVTWTVNKLLIEKFLRVSKQDFSSVAKMEWWEGMVDLANWPRSSFGPASLRSRILLAHSLITVVNVKIWKNSEFCFWKNRNIVLLERIRLKGNTIQDCTQRRKRYNNILSLCNWPVWERRGENLLWSKWNELVINRGLKIPYSAIV